MNENKTMDIYSRGEGENNMQTLPISEETREKLEDATLSVFMDQYAKALDAGIDSMVEECAEDAFPPELDQRIQKLIAKESARERNKTRRKTAQRVLSRAAAVVVVLLGACSVLFVTVEAFRLPIMNFFVEKTDSYWQMSGKEKNDAIPTGIDEKDPLGGIIPDDFSLSGIKGNWGSVCYMATYSNEDGAIFSFEVLTSDGNSQIDSEDAQITPTKLLGHDAQIMVEGNTIQVSWLDENRSTIFKISATNVAEEVVLNCVEAVAELLS